MNNITTRKSRKYAKEPNGFRRHKLQKKIHGCRHASAPAYHQEQPSQHSASAEDVRHLAEYQASGVVRSPTLLSPWAIHNLEVVGHNYVYPSAHNRTRADIATSFGLHVPVDLARAAVGALGACLRPAHRR